MIQKNWSDSMKYVYNKLVRDKIPEEINKMKGRKSNYKILIIYIITVYINYHKNINRKIIKNNIILVNHNNQFIKNYLQ